ncbi:hypothetical protein HMI55_005383 [Coelomomyces lativittatus]|nr:hypothetical protein HMI55_005383 [Coelomomyces lativittatus]
MSWSVCTTPTSLSPPLSVAPPSVRPPTTTFLLSPTLTASPTYSQLRPLTPTLEGPRRPRLISDTLCLSPRRPPPSMAMMDPFKMDMSIWNNDFDQDVKALELWFMDLSEQEKLKSMEALIQHVTSDQARYFMGVLSQLLKRNEPVPTLPPPPTTSTSSSYPQYPQHPSRLTHATNTIMMGSGGAGGPHQTLTSQSFPSSPSSVSSQAFDLSQHGWTRPYVDHTNPHGPPLSSPLPQTQSNMGTITPVNTPTTFPDLPIAFSRPDRCIPSTISFKPSNDVV